LIGSFGAFGLITSAHIRLNAVPTADKTLVLVGNRNSLLRSARAISASGNTPAAMELSSIEPRNQHDWNLSIRLMGSKAAVAADRRNIAAATSNIEFGVLEADSSANFWESAQSATAGTSTTIRMGCLQSELDTALDMLCSELNERPEANVSVSTLGGVIRWNGDATAAEIQKVRSQAAEQGWPITLERAPWEVLYRTGHYGGFSSGVRRLVTSLRCVFDDRGLLVAPLGNIA
jgi:hypothetical protein